MVVSDVPGCPTVVAGLQLHVGFLREGACHRVHHKEPRPCPCDKDSGVQACKMGHVCVTALICRDDMADVPQVGTQLPEPVHNIVSTHQDCPIVLKHEANCAVDEGAREVAAVVGSCREPLPDIIYGAIWLLHLPGIPMAASAHKGVPLQWQQHSA